jgi:hypothetical protein
VAEEAIPDQCTVSRLLFEPSMRREDEDLIWKNIFQFPSDQGQVESVVWRAKVADIKEVHSRGCLKQAADRAKQRSSTYIGAITGNVGAIRALRSGTGKSLTVRHFPNEGDEHAHVGFSPDATKSDRNQLKFLLRSMFGPLEKHLCLD